MLASYMGDCFSIVIFGTLLVTTVQVEDNQGVFKRTLSKIFFRSVHIRAAKPVNQRNATW